MGYYFGTRAGRERYNQLNGAVDALRRSEATRVLLSKSRAVANLALERSKDLFSRRSRHVGNERFATRADHTASASELGRHRSPSMEATNGGGHAPSR